MLYDYLMFDSNDYISADSIGAGLIIDDDMDVCIVLMVGSEGETASAVTMSVDTVEQLIDSLNKMISEAKLVQEAVFTMPEESAKQYLNNWAIRQRSEYN